MSALGLPYQLALQAAEVPAPDQGHGNPAALPNTVLPPLHQARMHPNSTFASLSMEDLNSKISGTPCSLCLCGKLFPSASSFPPLRSP